MFRTLENCTYYDKIAETVILEILGSEWNKKKKSTSNELFYELDGYILF